MRIGIDLGGSKIEAIALSDDGDELVRKRVSTPQQPAIQNQSSAGQSLADQSSADQYSAILQAIDQLVRDIESHTGQAGTLGIGTPGALSPATGLMRNSNTVCMNGRPVLDDLQSLMGREIRIANDANCFALSEATDGVAREEQVVFGVIIGTGTGAGIAIDKKLLVGPNAIAGEWGHNPLPWPDDLELPGATCYCGKTGCVETWLSGPGLVRDHALHHDERVDPGQLVRRAAAGDQHAEDSLARYEQRMARSLAMVINILDPHAIVLGGGMGNIERLYNNVPGLWGDYVFSDVVNTRLLAPLHGDSSGVRGAAWLWNE